MYCTCGNSAHYSYIAEISSSWSFMHYLSAWNNDCSRFHSLREETPFSALIKVFHLLVNFLTSPSPTSIQGHFPMSRGRPLNRGSSVIDKMNFHGIRGILLPWLNSYLISSQRTVWYGSSSSCLYLTMLCVAFPKALFFGPPLFF